MATRPAPRRITREEKQALAMLRKQGYVNPDNSKITITDLQNASMRMREADTAQQQGAIQSTYGLEGTINPTPITIQLDLSKQRALEGLMNKSSEGSGLANTMGRPNWVDRMYKFGDTYYPAKPGSMTESLNTIASFVKNNPRLAAESAALGTLGTFGRLTGTGNTLADIAAQSNEGGKIGIRRGTVESMRGELTSPATGMDVVDALSYVTPGSALKVGGKALSILSKASKTARVAGGLAAGLGGYAAYTGTRPEEANAASLSKFAELLGTSESAARNYARTQAKAITKRHRNRAWRQEFGDVKRPTGVDWWNDPKFEGKGFGDKVSTEQVYQSFIDWLNKYNAGDPTAINVMAEDPSNFNALHWGHDIPLAHGGGVSSGRFIPGSTNLKAGARPARKHAADVAKEEGITFKEAWNKLGYNIYDIK